MYKKFVKQLLVLSHLSEYNLIINLKKQQSG
jgi:hypothetical protein